MHERLPFVVIDLDTTLAVRAWNDRAERLFRTPRSAASGRSIADLLPLAGGVEAWRTVVAHRDDEPRVIAVDHPTAGTLHLEVWPLPNHDDSVTLYARDVSARVAAERRRALDSTLLGALKDNLELVVWAIDRQGTFLVQDGKALAAAGLTANQFVGQNLFALYGENDDTELIRGALAGKPGRSSPEIVNEQHGLRWESYYLPVDESKSDAAVVGVTIDVSEAKRREAELHARIDLIERQRETIRELSTPIIEVWDGVLTLPIVGLVDSVRTAEIMDNLLQTVTRTRSRYAILDLTGVQVVDTSTASHLIGLIQAIRLLGAEGVLTGIHPNIAQTIVNIGVDLARVRVFATLRDALKYCISKMSRRE